MLAGNVRSAPKMRRAPDTRTQHLGCRFVLPEHVPGVAKMTEQY